MSIRAYLSNLSPRWPFDRQVAALSEAVPGYPKGVTVLRDELSADARRARRTTLLLDRDNLLRETRRASASEVIMVASLAVLDWTAEGMLGCVSLALDRGATLRALDADITLKPGAKAGELHAAVKAFQDAKRKDQAQDRGKRGGIVSAAKREAVSIAKLAKIADRWPLPTKDHPTKDLLAEAGVTLNTAKRHLKARPVAQKNYMRKEMARARRKQI